MRKVPIEHVIESMRPESDVWQVLVEQADQGQADIYLVFDENLNEKYAVKFPDEPDLIPFDALAYSHEIGLYDTRNFLT